MGSLKKSATPGSSPRVRGKRRSRAGQDTLGGLIPARAGKTSPRGPRWSGTRAHPRACGENAGVWGRRCGGLGSSPRVRGKRGGGTRPRARRRLIPARAGKTASENSSNEQATAHPRACGENNVGPDPLPAITGSSPRVRGKPVRRTCWAMRSGLIPARAGKTSSTTPTRSCSWAHPRACGENLMNSSSSTRVKGSSPRVRGKQRFSDVLRLVVRLIPARAGKTQRRAHRGCAAPAHPRACGENLMALVIPERRLGSSPRVRGKRDDDLAHPCGARLIPACAGKTSPSPANPRRTRAHPRVCGENPQIPDDLLAGGGSSPRVRGKRRARLHEGRRRGLIPACAGKTSGGRWGSGRRRAHPRVCGENARLSSIVTSRAGSSPRVRGKHVRRADRGDGCGLIPACAGKTPRSWWGWTWRRAHPRVCGENGKVEKVAHNAQGSSPRVRGKRPRPCPWPWVRRLIPACAGKTKQRSHVWSGERAHPRVCGENDIPLAREEIKVGSSPRVRGKLRSLDHRLGHERLIPACAGKTPRSTTTSCPAAAHPRVCGEN